MRSTHTPLTLDDLKAAVATMPPIPTRAVCGVLAHRMVEKYAPRVIDELPSLFGLRIVADATLPAHVIEFRDRDDKVLARHELTAPAAL